MVKKPCIVCGDEAQAYCDYCEHLICEEHRYRVKGDKDACPKCWKEIQKEYDDC